MKKLLIAFLIFTFSLFTIQCFCQGKQGQNLVDSLLLEYPRLKDDSVKVNLLNRLSEVISRINPTEALKYGMEALALAEKIEWKKGIAAANETVGNAYMAKSDFALALEFYLKALKFYEETKNDAGTAGGFLNIGKVYYEQAYYTKALEYYFNALKLYEKLTDKKGIAAVTGKIGMVYYFEFEPKTLEYLNKALMMNEALGIKSGMAENLRFLGNLYNHRQKDYQIALSYYLKSLKIEEELEDKSRIARNLVNIGIVYGALNDHYKDLEYKFSGLKLYRELGEKGGIASAYGNLGYSFYFIATDSNEIIDPKLFKFHIHNKRDALLLSRAYMDSCNTLTKAIGELDAEGYLIISQIDSILGNYKEAFSNFKKAIEIKDSMFSHEKSKSIAQIQMQYEYDKKETEAKAEREKKSLIQRTIRNAVFGSLIATLIILGLVFRQRNRIRKEKKRSDDLLLNILPLEVAEELKTTGMASVKQHSNVTVLFTDFVNFTGISQQLSPSELVAEIHKNFCAFDQIIEKYSLEKIKTIGDAYMAACGLPHDTLDHAKNVVSAAIEIRDYIEKSHGIFQIRIGVNSGEVIAGIVGVKKFSYDIWGDTVNTASRMESNSESGKVNISESTYLLVKDHFKCESRGKISVKGKAEIEMYFAEKL